MTAASTTTAVATGVVHCTIYAADRLNTADFQTLLFNEVPDYPVTTWQNADLEMLF